MSGRCTIQIHLTMKVPGKRIQHGVRDATPIGRAGKSDRPYARFGQVFRRSPRSCLTLFCEASLPAAASRANWLSFRTVARTPPNSRQACGFRTIATHCAKQSPRPSLYKEPARKRSQPRCRGKPSHQSSRCCPLRSVPRTRLKPPRCRWQQVRGQLNRPHRRIRGSHAPRPPNRSLPGLRRGHFTSGRFP